MPVLQVPRCEHGSAVLRTVRMVGLNGDGRPAEMMRGYVTEVRPFEGEGWASEVEVETIEPSIAQAKGTLRTGSWWRQGMLLVVCNVIGQDSDLLGFFFSCRGVMRSGRASSFSGEVFDAWGDQANACTRTSKAGVANDIGHKGIGHSKRHTWPQSRLHLAMRTRSVPFQQCFRALHVTSPDRLDFSSKSRGILVVHQGLRIWT